MISEINDIAILLEYEQGRTNSMMTFLQLEWAMSLIEN